MNWQIKHIDDTYGINKSAKTPCLLIAGWSMDSEIFSFLMPGLAQFFQVYSADYSALTGNLSHAAQTLADALPFDVPAVVVGWSLGGNLAIELAAQFPEKVAGLALISCSPCFVQRDNWPYGMAKSAFAQFEQSLEQASDKAIKRFDTLQAQGDNQQAALTKAIKSYRAQQTPWRAEDLQQGLHWLQQCDQRQSIAALKIPQVWFFAENDTLVNEQTQTMLTHNQQTCYSLKQASHLCFLSQPDIVFSLLLNHLLSSVEDNKQKIAKAFSAAANTYDNAANVQQYAANYLLDKITLHNADLLFADIGCGTGRHTQVLAQKTRCIGLDLAFGMLTHAKTHNNAPQLWIHGDAEYLPFADNSLDGIFSNLAVQWSQAPNQLLQEWFRALKPGGKVYVSTLGTKSLFELRQSFAKTDNEAHVNIFAHAEQWQQYAQSAGFVLRSIEQEIKKEYYPDLLSLLRGLKNIGAQTVLYRKDHAFISKKRWQTLQEAYQKFATNDGLPISYQLIFMCLEKPYA